ncbi:hypothetical protein [Pseudescherichia sp.]|uniref:hypothetical protein n=1 Tax=Pseudescherichia sp. TaxID=2055881 RepID=UPI0028AB392B|nr:hypothetical protein [Pseudescherichia sp.]
MSWDNVSSIKNIKIWTDYSDSTQGHLFINNNHQLLLNVGISFNLKSSTTAGPTQQEVSDALSLINDQDSGPLKYLTLSDKGKFTAIYDPSLALSVADSDAASAESGTYDYQLTYYVYSPTSMNAEAHAEGVALKLAYTDASGNKVVQETSATGNYYTKTCVYVTCYPAKLYGMEGENRTNITYSTKVVAAADCWDYSGNFNHSEDTFKVISFYIDDPYFKLFYFDGCSDPNENYAHNPYYIYKAYSKPKWDIVYNAFFPNVKCGAFDYGVQIVLRSDMDDSHTTLLTEHIEVHQQQNQITFLGAHTSVEGLNHSTDMSNRVRIQAYDQFGNSAYIVAFSNGANAMPFSIS